MWFWWFMFAVDLLTPGIMILGGWMMWKHCPQEINRVYGYRTERSMKNMGTWKFAHDHCGRLWWKTGWLMLVPSALVLVPFFHGSEETIGTVGLVLCMVHVVVLILSIFPTEAALKKTFFDDGTRK